MSEIITFSNASSWEHGLVLKTEEKKEKQSLIRHSEVLVSASGMLCTKGNW